MAAAFGAWRHWLDDTGSDAEAEVWISGCERIVRRALYNEASRHEFHWPAHSQSGATPSMAWSFDVLYVVDEQRRQRGELRLRWTVRRARGGGAPLIVEGTCLSFADELAASLGDRLEPEDVTGTLRLRSSGLSFGELVHDVPRAARELVSKWVRPLIIVGPITTEDEVVAQLAVFALRAGRLLDDPSSAFVSIERWLRRLVRERDKERISEAAGIVLSRWSRPMSARSFRDYCRRTVRGLAKDTARRDADQRGAGAGPEIKTVDDLARRTGVPRRTLYRWLRQGRIEGCVASWSGSVPTAGGLSIRRKRYQYNVDQATVDRVDGAQQERTLRRSLISELARRRGTTPRAARALVQRRLDRGWSFEDLARELLMN